jgi:hypothetical protein
VTTEEFVYQLIIRGIAAGLAAGVASESRLRGGPILWATLGALLGLLVLIPLLVAAFFRRPPTLDQ